MNSEPNKDIQLAWEVIANTNMSVFLTGKAGTGKTTFLKQLRQQSPKRMVVLAPTGVAAINAEGQTIHSFFQLPFGPIVPGVAREQSKRFSMSKEKKNLIKTLDLLVIDEISMVRCDLLDAIDMELRKYRQRGKPFGGVQLLLIGDLQQLAPVTKDSEWQLLSPHYFTPYFFGSKALQQTPYITIELKHIYRQQDEQFISLLGKVRNNRIDNETLNLLNGRYMLNFTPPENEDWIRLTTHNRMADEYNAQMLAALPDDEWKQTAQVSGNFPETSYPADKELVLKKGAQVMFIKNDPSVLHEYYNGKIGIVTDFSEDGISVFTKEDNTYTVVPQVTWENTKYVLDNETKAIREEVEGTFRQYPLRLAWAITVHKSQGLTFDHAVLDINDSFAHGQTYVALSRCRTLQGLVLARPLSSRSIITDSSVNAFIDNELQQLQTVQERLPQMAQDYMISLLDEAFSFEQLYNELQYVQRIVDEHLYRQQGEYLGMLTAVLPKVKMELCEIAERFARQYRQILQGEAISNRLQETAPNTPLQSRIHAAANYFLNKTEELLQPIIEQGNLTITNKQISKQYTNAFEVLKDSYRLKIGIFSHFTSNTFTVQDYLRTKAVAILGEDAIEKKPKKPQKRQAVAGEEDPVLFEALRRQRLELATEKNVPAYIIFSDKAMHALASVKPTTIPELINVYGFGKVKADQYGERVLDLIKEYK